MHAACNQRKTHQIVKIMRGLIQLSDMGIWSSCVLERDGSSEKALSQGKGKVQLQLSLQQPKLFRRLA